MKQLFKFLIGFLFIFSTLFASQGFAVANSSAAQDVVDAATPAGYWRQIDDKTGQLESILQIWQANGVYYARPLKAFTINGVKPDVYCTKCTGKLHNAKIIGMTVMWGMRAKSSNVWSGGQIVDPKSGKVYRCKMTLEKNGQQLDVRGYIGISLLGRSQTWYRTTAAKAGLIPAGSVGKNT